MEPSSDIFRPWLLYSRGAWAALAGSILSIGCGVFAPFALVSAGLLALTSLTLFWLAARPALLISEARCNIGKRAIAWQEISAIDQLCSSPLILRLELTNQRRKLLVFPGDPRRTAELITQLRERSFLATFDGVPYRDYALWSKLSDREAGELGLHQPKKMASAEEELEIERLFQTLKASGKLDAASKDHSAGSKKD